MAESDPILSVKDFWYADANRTLRRRIPGACTSLLNLAPNKGEGESIRRGYEPYSGIIITNAGSGYLVAPTVTFSSGTAAATAIISEGKVVDIVITDFGSGYSVAPTITFSSGSAAATAQITASGSLCAGRTQVVGLQKHFFLPIQTPAQDDVLLQMSTGGVFQNPYYNGAGTKLSNNIKINETVSFTGAAGSFPAANQMTITGSDALGLSSTANYYKGWRMDNTSQSEIALVSAYTYSSAASGTSTFTFVEDVDATGLNWVVTNSFAIYRNYHDNPTFAPAYNTGFTNPPFALADISRLYFSGGLSSTTGNAAMISTYNSKTFFPGVSNRSFAMTQTYVSEERLKIPVFSGSGFASTTTSNHLTAGKTYWVGIAAVSHGFQIGELKKYETTSDYVGSGWSNNYLATDSANAALTFSLLVKLGSLNKNITGYVVFLAIDDGDTRTLGRQNQYQYIGQVSVTSTDRSKLGLSGTWAFSGTDGWFAYTIVIDQLIANARTSTYIEASGMEETPADTSYSYSSRLVLNEKHYLSNVYITSEAIANREEIFTNPRGGLAGVNSGINQPSLFPNDQGFFRKGIELAIGTKINCMAKVGLGELLTIKDRGLILNRIIEESDGTIQTVSQILDQNIGCSTLNGFTQLDADEGGLIFFAGYDDIYLYDNSRFQRLIERKDEQDWLYQYRIGISKSGKESVALMYLADGILLLDIAQTSGQQYQLYTQYIPNGWRQVAFKQTSGFTSTVFFGQFSKLQNGTVIGLSTESPAKLYQFSNATTGAHYYKDNGTSIRYNLNTGNVVPSGSEAYDTVFDGFEVGRYVDLPTQGTLNAIITKDADVIFTERTSLDKTSQYLEIPVQSDEPQTGNSWGLQINSNISSPEVLNAGSDFRITGLYYFGRAIPREKRPTESAGGTTVSPPIGTIGGAYEFLITAANTWETKTFDTAFTGTYSSLDGDSASPTWRMSVYTARTGTGGDVAQADILFRNITLTGFDVRSPEPLTLCKYGITHI